MTVLLSYVYNLDLIDEEPNLPYFIMAKLEKKDGSFEMFDDFNEALRQRRRK
jgi:hypothetical protein